MKEYKVELVSFNKDGEKIGHLNMEGITAHNEQGIRDHCLECFPSYEIKEIEDISTPKTPENEIVDEYDRGHRDALNALDLDIGKIEEALRDRGLEGTTPLKYFKQKLQDALAVEDYEKAAEIRDAIKQIEL